MTKQELINQLAQVSLAKGVKIARADLSAIVDALGEVVEKALQDGHDVVLPKLGRMTVAKRAARTGRNPLTGVTMEVAARNVPVFKPIAALKQAVNQ